MTKEKVRKQMLDWIYEKKHVRPGCLIIPHADMWFNGHFHTEEMITKLENGETPKLMRAHIKSGQPFLFLDGIAIQERGRDGFDFWYSILLEEKNLLMSAFDLGRWLNSVSVK